MQLAINNVCRDMTPQNNRSGSDRSCNTPCPARLDVVGAGVFHLIQFLNEIVPAQQREIGQVRQ
ncbi:hypothetical protein J4734_25035 [Klebsiella pneumoniae]|uniref:Uncharacterized protein n=1 Tax=Klebsiella pneumoniae TaxID=573 RepID=A0A939NNK2_KLEPN|nr:hypothetical protein [Klebsiella pneumoniae]